MAPIHILLVDDEDEFRASTVKAMVRRGFAVREAATGEQALVLLETEPADLMVLDLRMPGMGGIETLAKLREQNQHLPVVILIRPVRKKWNFQSRLAFCVSRLFQPD